MRRIAVFGLLASLALSACGGDTATPGEEVPEVADLSYDVSGVEQVDEIAALLPQEIADKGTLIIGASTDYAPAEFRSDDLDVAIGYDIDLGKALGNVLGLDAQVEDAEFASILPGIGTRYDIGISSFTITEERMASYNMISYIMVGSSYAVPTGNPDDFDPDAVCGQPIAVQTGTYQADELEDFSAACVEAGEDEIEIVSYARQSDATTNVVGGRAAAFYADSTVAGYAASLTGDRLEVVGGIRDSAPQGIVTRQQDEELTQAMLAAMQHLMDEGVWDAILDSWGVEDASLDTAELNPPA